mgnify:CR=1 FL=1
MRRSLAFNLEQAGYRASTAESAETALAQVHLERPDLVLLDISRRGVATATLNRPEVGNAYNEDMLDQLIAGLESPTSGNIEQLGRAALMFQEPALFPWLTASQNVELALRLSGVGAADRRARDARVDTLERLLGSVRRIDEADTLTAILQALGVSSRTQAVIAASKIESGQWRGGVASA